MNTHAERFRHLLAVWNLTQEELGNLCGIKRGTVGTIVNGKTIPDADALGALLRKKPDLNPDWLLTGTGAMLRDGTSLTPFFAGGKVNKMGATVMPKGGTPDLDMGDANPGQSTIKGSGPVAQTDREFIDTLLAKISRESMRADQAEAREAKLYGVVHEQAGTIRFLQEQINDLQLELRGKEAGNQLNAPGDYTALATIATLQVVSDAATAVKKAFTPVPAKKIWTKPAGFLQAHRMQARLAVQARRQAWRKAGRHLPARIYAMYQDEQPMMELLAA